MNSRCERLRGASAAVAGAYASRLPSWAPVGPATMAKSSRSECSYREAAAIRSCKEARLAGNFRSECSHRELAAMGQPAVTPRPSPNWGDVCQPRCPALLPNGKVLTSGSGRHGSPERRAIRCQGRIAAYSSVSRLSANNVAVWLPCGVLCQTSRKIRDPPCQGRGVAHVSRRVARLSPKVARFESSVARDGVLSSPPSPYPSRRQAMLASSLVYVLPLGGRHAARED